MSDTLWSVVRRLGGFEDSNYPEIRIKNCPSCGDTHSHLYFNVEKRVGDCKKCGYTPTLFELLSRLEGISIAEARDRLSADSPRQYRSSGELNLEYEDNPLPRFFQPFDGKPEDHPDRFVNYLSDRGLTWDQIKTFGLGYCRGGKYMWKVIVPVRMFGKTVSFQARDITGLADAKYRNPDDKGMNEFARYIFNFDTARAYPHVFVAEGVFDCMNQGYDCVGTFGKKISAVQLHLLRTYWERVTLLFDPDAALETLKLSRQLSQLMPIRFILWEGGDPGETPRSEIDRMCQGVPFSDDKRFEAYLQKVRNARRSV